MSSTEYRYIIAEVIDAPDETNRHPRIRAKPLPGQWASPDCRIDCPAELRDASNVGQLYKFLAKFKYTDRASQLYTSYRWEPERVSREAAEAFIAASQWQ